MCPYQNLVQGGRSFGIHHQYHEIRRLATQLEPDVDAFQSVRAPWELQPCPVQQVI